MTLSFQDKASFIWSVADLLRGDFKQYDYQKVILPLTVLRRLDCVLEPTKEKVLKAYDKAKKGKIKNFEPLLNRASGYKFHNRSKLDFAKLKADPNNIAANLTAYINGFSERAREIIEKFRFDEQIHRLEEANILYLVISKFAEIDLHPDAVPNTEMGYIFEELIRKFAEQSNETAGEHFTPREVIRLMVNILFHDDADVLTKKGIVKTLYDPACGTGGMLSVAEEYLKELNPDARLEVYGQELNDESFAICNSDMMLKGQDPDNIKSGNSFTHDHLHGHIFDYMLSNPPFGVEWKKAEKEIRDESEKQGFSGRFGAGLPRINDGSLLFLQHMIDKMKPEGSRLAIVFNGSPLFTGSAGSGESDIRKWIIENDWLEAIVAMPDQLFYNTGILTYIWVLTNRKARKRKGKVQLINGVSFFEAMRKSLGNKRHQISEKQIAELTRIHGDFEKYLRASTHSPGATPASPSYCKIFDNDDFGYQRITVERPLKLNFQASDERIALLQESKPFQKLPVRATPASPLSQEQILSLLRSMDQNKIYKNADQFESDLEIALPATIKKAILSALSERDETADVCKDAKGNPEPDPDLRDYENVPLKEKIHKYFEREVLPHVPDAWIDEEKTKIGYEIPFTRHFYEYTPPRPLEQIEAEIKQLEGEIQGLLGEVMG
jgi:type I restriction enzyme M protein